MRKASHPHCLRMRGFSRVELRGLEPLTPTLPVWCATSCAIAPYSVVLRTRNDFLRARRKLHHCRPGQQIAWSEALRARAWLRSPDTRQPRTGGGAAYSCDTQFSLDSASITVPSFTTAGVPVAPLAARA